MILAIDTSSNYTIVALQSKSESEQPQISVSRFSSIEASHNESLSTIVDLILTENKLEPKDLSEIWVGIGPGSFTGIRIGISYALGLSVGLGIPIITFPSHLLYAATVFSDIENDSLISLVIVDDARREEVFVSEFTMKDGTIVKSTQETIKSIKLFEEANKGKPILIITPQLKDNFDYMYILSDYLINFHKGCRLLLSLNYSCSQRFFNEEIHKICPLYIREVSARSLKDRGISMSMEGVF